MEPKMCDIHFQHTELGWNSVILGCSKSFESGNENTFFFGEITFIAQYNLP